MLVAASRDDLQSDTQWLRSDVDRYFYDSAIQSGVDSLVNSNIESLLRDHGRRKWNAVVSTEFDGLQHVEADWLIDSSGSGVALSKWLGTNDDSEWMHVKTGAVFGHFTNVAPFSSQLYRAEEDIRNYFDGDDAAQHHLVDQGWFWMLRFDHGVTSVGRVFPSQDLAEYASGKMLWEESLRRYPAVAELLRNSECIAPQGGLATIKRMSRCSSKAVGRGWLAMPTTFGFVDPLHSTGIAHGLSGVCRAAEILLGEESNVESKLTIYERELREEVKWIDSLVGGCYAAQRSFPKFCAMTCLYFLGAIQTERELRNSNVESGNGFLGYRDRKLQLLQANLHQRLLQEPNEEPERFLDDVRREIEPWNDVGLLDRANPFRVAHTVDK